MKYSEFRDGVIEMLLDQGSIFGTEAYRDRQVRVALAKAMSFFPTLRHRTLLSIPSRDIIVEGNACVAGIPVGIDITEINLVPSGWVFTDNEALTATTDGAGVITDGPSIGSTFVLTDPAQTGWEAETLLYGIDDGAGAVVPSLASDGDALIERSTTAQTIKYRRVEWRDDYNTRHILGPFTPIPWENRRRLINGVVTARDLFYSVSPERDHLVIHPIINFERLLQVWYRKPGSKFEDNDLLNIPEGLEDEFVTVCSDYVRSRFSKDVERNASQYAANLSEFKQGLRSLFKEIPR